MELYLLALAAFSFAIVLTLLLNNKGKTKEPPQAKGAWPFIGHLHLLGGGVLPQKVLGDMADKYGPIFTIKLGVHQALVVSNSETAKECYTTNDKVFASRPKSQAVELMGYNYAMFGLAPSGDYWRQVRKIMMLQLLSQRRVEMLRHVRASEVRASMEDIIEAWVKNKESSIGMVKMEMRQWCGNLILNIVVRVVSGKRFSIEDEEGVRFQNVARRFFELLGAFVVSDFIPYLKRLDIGGYEKEMKKKAMEMDNIIQGWLEENKRDKESKQHQGKEVLIDVLISILEGASEEDFPGFHHDTIIKASCLVNSNLI